jgi:CRISPR-associated protein Csd2
MTLVQLKNQEIITDPTKRHVATFFWDIWMGNPNGDPERDNHPRQNLNDLHGYVTDAAIKRKIRDFWARYMANQDGFRIYVQSSAVAGALNTRLVEADLRLFGARESSEDAQANGATQAGKAAVGTKAAKRTQTEEVALRRRFMVQEYIDNRVFGAVMGTGNYPAGHATGPVQISFARSIDEIEIMDMQITRVAVTQEEEVKRGKVSEFGRKAVIPYALYQSFAIFNAPLAQDTGVTAKDLEMLWVALQSVWELDRSAAKGMQYFRGMVIWSQDNPYGNAHAQELLLDRVKVQLKEGKKFPRQFEDYTITINDTNLPKGVTCTKIGFDRFGA